MQRKDTPLFMKKHLPIILVLLLSFLLHILFLVEHPGYFNLHGSRDAQKYDEMAHRLIEEGIYAYNSEESNAYVTPAHPLYLTGIILLADVISIDYMVLVRLFNMVLSITTVWLVYAIPKRLFEMETISILSALLYGTYLAPLHYFRSMLTETPSIFMFMFSIYIFIAAIQTKSTKLHVLFGFTASIAIMFRPTPAPMLLFAWAIVIYQTGFKNAMKVGLIWWIGPLFIIFPWSIRNLIVLGAPYIFSSHSGNPMLLGTNPYYLIPEETLAAKWREIGIEQREYAIIRIIDGFRYQFALWFSWFTLGKTIWMFQQPEPIGNYYKFLITPAKWYIYLNHFFVVFSSFITGLIFRKHKPLFCLFIILVSYLAISNVFLPLTRYGSFIFPVMCIIGSYGAVVIAQKLVQLKRKIVS
ncbi:ArnT family glycosyltransferase [Priestia abyssalis]|uniref:ArnT family glycosyltransferase n=1 Tax=Priestia abyssalis TaxID=1221450 RepID=UPI000994D0D6|nr:glycosyltransferase family 39 protein [Priestia abyssalis]